MVNASVIVFPPDSISFIGHNIRENTGRKLHVSLAKCPDIYYTEAIRSHREELFLEFRIIKHGNISRHIGSDVINLAIRHCDRRVMLHRGLYLHIHHIS